jgi:hypothetical protein
VKLKNSKNLQLSISLLFGILYCSLFLVIRNSKRWDLVSIPAMSPEFGDLKAVTSAVDCTKKLDFVDVYSTNCDVWGRPFNYPTIWVDIFKYFNLGSASTEKIGITFLLITSFLLSFWCFFVLRLGMSIFKLIVFAGLLFSPSVYLLNERGNVDIVIVCLISLSLWLYCRKHELLAVFIVTLAATLKVFPLALLLAILLFTKNCWTRVFSIAGILVTVVYLKPLLPFISSNTPTSFNYSFGFYKLVSTFLPSTYGQTSVIVFTALIFASVVIIFTLITFFFRKFYCFMQIQQLFLAEIRVNTIFLLAWPVFVTVYLTMTSYNYRLIFILPIMATLLSQNSRISIFSAILFMIYGIFAMRFGPTSKVLDFVLFSACLLASSIWIYLFQRNFGNPASLEFGDNFLQRRRQRWQRHGYRM